MMPRTPEHQARVDARVAADRHEYERRLVHRLETFDEAELLRALRELAANPDAAGHVNDALDAIARGDA
jgi:hypothetical protein